ncbi:MAG: hypothetical protein M3N41_14170 [Acidobacteriota bacterium]|nr:hypothetical protein [Acidobacteriota bacterium]
MHQDKPTCAADGGFSIQAAVKFDPIRFLAVLNGEEIRANTQGALASRYWDPPAQDVCAQLRAYVDEFLNTGVLADVETPRLRDATKAANALRALRRFNRNNPMQLEIFSDSVSIEFAGGKSVTIGELARRPLETPQAMADRFFGLLFLSGWTPRLAKCRRAECGRYFWLKHWNRIYKRGTSCPMCTRVRSLESALIHTAETRKAIQTELYRLTAKRFSKQIAKTPGWGRDSELRAKIIDFLSAKILGSERLSAFYPHGITGKWLSWSKNQQGIANAVREDANAKG